MTSDLREALEGALGWCIEQAEGLMAISSGGAPTHGDDTGALQAINSMASDIIINLQMALAPDPAEQIAENANCSHSHSTPADTFECADCRLAHPGDCMKAGYCEHRDTPHAAVLYDLADRVAALKGADRNLDAEIAERAFGWKRCPVAADARGENAGEVLTSDGRPIGGGFTYPPRGAIHLAYHCPTFTRNCHDQALPSDVIRRQTVEALRSLAVRERRQNRPGMS